MKISYNWLKSFLPVNSKAASLIKDPAKLAEILTSVGLEVEDTESYSSVKGDMKGVVTGEVVDCREHPDADRLKVTMVNIGNGEPLSIVCGAPNVAKGQKVMVATVGTELFPADGKPLQIKKAKIRGVESKGMICAEDELGVGASHDGILILPPSTAVGMPAAGYFQLYTDTIFNIGLTPNRMDAQSHMGVARDVCAYLSHHAGEKINMLSPLVKEWHPGKGNTPIKAAVKDSEICARYAGVTITGITIGDAPIWIQNYLRSIGLKPVNNVVDITNFILHSTGQPLHAFDADKIKGNKIVVKTLPEGTVFKTLDEKERKLGAEDIMICDADSTPLCIAGVFGGWDSGVSSGTKNIFLESAVFNPVHTRKSIIRHGLRTEAAIRFEKGVDIDNTVKVLAYAANLIKEITGGEIAGDLVDVYPDPNDRKEVRLPFEYLTRLSGKEYEAGKVRGLLESLQFEIIEANDQFLQLGIPRGKQDIALPADVVEEILRIDGLDNIAIPDTLRMQPAIPQRPEISAFKERILQTLAANGFSEIFTNSITSEQYYNEQQLEKAVPILNSLSGDLTIMRPDMLHSGLESLAYNINRQNKDLRFFEDGKIYGRDKQEYWEKELLIVLITGHVLEAQWMAPEKNSGIFYAKGIAEALLQMAGINHVEEDAHSGTQWENAIQFTFGNHVVMVCGEVSSRLREKFSIKQPVFALEIYWNELLLHFAQQHEVKYEPVSRFPTVIRDISMIVDSSVKYGMIREMIQSLKLKKLSRVHLFDLFESERLGKDKKSLAISLTFIDKEKTLTDKDTDKMMNTIMKALESKAGASIRSNA